MGVTIRMEETISLQEIIGVLKKRLGMILGITVLAGLISALVTIFVLTPTYQASSQFIVNQEQNPQSQQFGIDSNDIRTNVQLINTYNVILTSPAILEDVISELSLNTSSESLAGKINVSSAEESQVVNVQVTDTDPEQAVAIANTTVETFQTKIPDIMNVNNVNILTQAEVGENPQPVSPNTTLNIAIAIVVGLMIGVGLAFLLEYFDNTIKTEQEIDDVLGLPVMGVVSSITEKDTVKTAPIKTNPKASAVRRESIGS